MSRCLKCNNDLTTFDTGSVCRQCKQAEDKITMLQMSDTKSGQCKRCGKIIRKDSL